MRLLRPAPGIALLLGLSTLAACSGGNAEATVAADSVGTAGAAAGALADTAPPAASEAVPAGGAASSASATAAGTADASGGGESVAGQSAVADADAGDGPPAGTYLCYYYGMQYDLTSSSLVQVKVLGGSRLEITGKTVPFRAAAGDAFALVGGPFPGLVFHHRTDDAGKAQLVFVRKENEANGHRIDISDTYCYPE